MVVLSSNALVEVVLKLSHKLENHLEFFVIGFGKSVADFRQIFFNAFFLFEDLLFDSRQ